MTTEKQLQANRQNALKSTGPKSSTGKMIASRNSTKHGFYSTSVLLPSEDPEEFLSFARRLALAYSPCGVREEQLVKTIIETHWQLRRANLIDSELFQIYGFYKGENRGVGTAFAQDATQGNAFTKLTRYQTFLMRKVHLAEQDLLRLQAPSTLARPIAQPALLPPQGSQPRNDTAPKPLLRHRLSRWLGHPATSEDKPVAQEPTALANV